MDTEVQRQPFPGYLANFAWNTLIACVWWVVSILLFSFQENFKFDIYIKGMYGKR